MTTVNYFDLPPLAPLRALTTRPARTAVQEFDAEELFWLWLVIEHCYRSQSITDASAVFEERLPEHARALTYMLADDLENGLLSAENPWVPPSLMNIDGQPQFTRSALPLTRSKFAMAKSLLKQILSNAQALKRLNALLVSNPRSKLHIAVIYATFDLSSPLPLSTDRRLLWCLIADLLQNNKPDDLSIWAADALPPIPAANAEGQIPAELSPNEHGDPYSILRQLYTVLRPTAKLVHARPSSGMPYFDVYIGVDDTGCGSGGSWPILGRRQSFMIHRVQCVPPAGTPILDIGRREIRAILDAATCWAHMWAGHAVRFHVSSPELRARINDFGGNRTAQAQRWPEIDLLHALAHRWNFIPETLPSSPTSQGTIEARANAFHKCLAYENTARCVQTVDSLLMDIFAERLTENPPDQWWLSFVHFHLELELRMLSAGGVPGVLYYAMRDAQKESAPVGRESEERATTEPLEVPSFDAAYKQSQAQQAEAERRAKHFRLLEADRRVRDEAIPVRARAMEDAENDAENAIGAVLTFEPYLDYLTSEHQDWLEILWQYDSEASGRIPAWKLCKRRVVRTTSSQGGMARTVSTGAAEGSSKGGYTPSLSRAKDSMDLYG